MLHAEQLNARGNPRSGIAGGDRPKDEWGVFACRWLTRDPSASFKCSLSLVGTFSPSQLLRRGSTIIGGRNDPLVHVAEEPHGQGNGF